LQTSGGIVLSSLPQLLVVFLILLIAYLVIRLHDEPILEKIKQCHGYQHQTKRRTMNEQVIITGNLGADPEVRYSAKEMPSQHSALLSGCLRKRLVKSDLLPKNSRSR